jgi:DMSO/TMAO reductase YedYZ molybdopterin-dependent catalytic subunit
MSEPEGGAPRPGGERERPADEEARPVRRLDPADVIPLAAWVPPAAGPGAPPLPAAAPSPPETPRVAPRPAPAADEAPPVPRAVTRRPAAPGRNWLAERPEVAIEIPRRRLAAQSRRDFMLFWAGVAAAAAGAWWLLPDRARSRIAPGRAFDALDSIAARTGLSRARRERVLDRALTFDDDVAEALYSKDRSVRTYSRSEVTPLRNNYDGRTPGPEYLPTWRLGLSGLASGRVESLAIADLFGRFALHEQVTRLVCVEGWSAVAWWGGIRFADVLAAFPPAPGARWAAMRSAVNLDGSGRSDPYYVSIDLATARHPQTLLATHLSGRPLTVEHGAPMRLLVPMKLGLKNIKAVTDIAYTAEEPADYWNERGYSKYDGL